MRGLASASIVVSACTLGACAGSTSNLDEIRQQLDDPTAELDTELATNAENASIHAVPVMRALSCAGYLYSTLQKFVSRVGPSSGDGGVDDGGSDEFLVGGRLVRNFSGSVGVDAPCPGLDGVSGTTDDGTLNAHGKVHRSVLEPVWSADFRTCGYSTDCSQIFANGTLLVDFGKDIAPGGELPLEELLLRYSGSVGVTADPLVEGTIAGRHRPDGVDVVVTGSNGKTAGLGVDDDGTIHIDTAEGTWTCDFSVNHCALAGTSRVFDW